MAASEKQAVALPQLKKYEPDGMRSLGPCPKCGSPVLSKRKFICSKAHSKDGGCDFALRRQLLGRKFSTSEIRTLLTHGCTDVLEGFVKRPRSRRAFAAHLVLGIKGQLRLELEDSELARDIAGEHLFLNVTSSRKLEPSLAGDLGTMDCVGACPRCGSPVLVTELRYDCSKALSGRRACRFSVRKKIKDREVTPEEFKSLLSHRRIGLLEGFVSRKRKVYVFASCVSLGDNGKLKYTFPEQSVGP